MTPSSTPEPATPDAGPGGSQVIDTRNKALGDGVDRCPQCGATEARLRPSTGKLLCLFCRHEWAEANFDETHARLDTPLEDLSGTVIASGASDIQADTAVLLTLKCQGCGAEVVVDTAHATNARCHWCRHVLTLNHQIPNGAVPDAVLPFKITHDDAVARIRAFADGRRFFANARFKTEFAPENVMGVYLPYMVVDAKAAAAVAGQGEIELRSYTRGSGKNAKTYYDADVYRVDRRIRFTADDMAIESSAGRANMDTRVNTNNIINAILPFDTKQAVVWNADYLIGFTSEKRDQNVTDLTPALEDRLMSIARAQVRPSLKQYDRGVRWEREKLDVAGTRWVAMYLPVWLYSYFQPGAGGGKGLLHYIAVNARTSETMGSIPVATGKLVAAAVVAGIVAEIIAIVLIALLTTSDGDNNGIEGLLLAAGPMTAIGFYRYVFHRYRNTDKTDQYERETAVRAQPIEGSDTKVKTITGTRMREIEGRNESNYRQRVTRVR